MQTALDEKCSHHEAHEGHEERRHFSSFALGQNLFSLRALRVLRGESGVFFLVAVLPGRVL